jgi:hypothetical protein
VGFSAVAAQDKRPAAPAENNSRVKEPELAKELLRRYNADQEARKDFIKFEADNKLFGNVQAEKLDPKIAQEYKSKLAKFQAIDRDNLKWIKAVVAKHGWPGTSLVGVIGAQHAWLLVQHADSDHDFQESCLKKMESMPKGEADPQHLAYLADRILVGKGKKQKYGTQGMFKEGKIVPSPIEDEANVDARRKAIGLMPLADYLKTLEAMYKSGDGAKSGK